MANKNEYQKKQKLFKTRLILPALLILFLSFFETSCKSTGLKAADNLRPVYITNSKKIKLLGPENAARALDTLQLFNGRFGQNTFSLLSYSQIDEKEIRLSLFNDFGTDMGMLFFDGKSLSFESAFLPEKLPGEYILAEIQNAYYDENALKQMYEKAGLTFTLFVEAGQKENEKLMIRKIYDGKKLIEEITISEKKVTIINHLRDYSFELVNAE